VNPVPAPQRPSPALPNYWDGFHVHVNPPEHVAVPSIGIEEEYVLVNRDSREVFSGACQVIPEAQERFSSASVHRDLMQSVVECVTNHRNGLPDAAEQLSTYRATISQLARKHNADVTATGTHPFSKATDQVNYSDSPHYIRLVDQWPHIMRTLATFGMHVHIGFNGIQDANRRIQLMNAVRTYLPMTVAMSANSPFWEGSDTGYACWRLNVFRQLPRTYIPEPQKDYASFREHVRQLSEFGLIGGEKDLWWLIRPSVYETIESRIADMPITAGETMGIASFLQGVSYHLLKQDELHYLPTSQIDENVYQAQRYGLTARFVDWQAQKAVTMMDAIQYTVETIRPALKELGTERYVDDMMLLLKTEGTGADRQRKIFKNTGDLKAVVDYLIEQGQKPVQR